MPTLFPTRNAPAIAAIQPAVSVNQIELVWGVCPLFDFAQDRFLLNGHNDLILSNEATALSQWITGAIVTPRLRHYIHRRIFGSDFDLLVAKNYPQAILKKYAEKYTTEALQGDSRIASVRSVDARAYRRYVVVDCTIITRSGFEQQFQVKWSV